MLMTRRMLVAFLMGCILTIGVDVYAGEEEGILEGSHIQVSGDIAINSDYVWRGFMLDDDPVMQQGAYASACGFTVSIWGSFGIASDDGVDSDEIVVSHEFLEWRPR